MPVTRLTARNVGTLKPIDGERTDYVDDVVPGFMLRVSPTGARSYAVLYYSPEGKRTRFTIGDESVLSLADARQAAREVLAGVTRGEDPHAVKVALRRRGGDTFSDLCDRFLADQKAALHSSTWAGWRRYIEVEVKPVLGDLAPLDITRGDVRTLVEKIVKRGSPVSANRAFEVVRRVFTWAMSKDLIAASPCARLPVTQEEKPRTRTYSPDEIRAILAAVPGTELENLVPLILYTAARSGEGRSVRWSDLDLERNLWTVPGEHSKNGEAHPVPLSRGALRVLASGREEQQGQPSEFLFPAPTKEGYLDKPNKHVTIVRERSKVSDFRLHDVRRTVATLMHDDLGVPPYVVDAVLGHTPAKLTRTYMTLWPVREMAAALDSWERHLSRIISGKGKTRKGAFVPFARA